MHRFLDPALAARLKPLELRARHIVEGFLTGLHRSPYHGFSVEFAEHRPYNPGDELRRLDWKVLAKTDRPFVKQFEEETNLRCTLVVDSSLSMRYSGSASLTKLEYAATLGAALAFLLLRQRDAVGLMAFDERVHTVVPPRSASSHLRPLLAALERLADVEPAPTPTAAARALAEVAERLHRRSFVVVLSDLFENRTDADDLLRALRQLRHRGHQVLVFHLLDAATERRLDVPTDGRPVTLIDRETNEKVTLHVAQAQAAYETAVRDYTARLRRGCLEHGIDFHELDTAAPLDDALLRFLAARHRAG
ncbi:MAG TPA: DUF58 domain-containing protein [Rhodothermales bacterium]|nr:DUF58 domain-containing protein [Rhodothermales bacterium]